MLDVGIFGGSWLLSIILLMIAIQFVAKHDAETNPYLSIFWGFVLFAVETAMFFWAFIKGPDTGLPLGVLIAIVFLVVWGVGILVVSRFLYASLSQSVMIGIIVVAGKVLYLVFVVQPLLSMIHEEAEEEVVVLALAKWEEREVAGLQIYTPADLEERADLLPAGIKKLSEDARMVEVSYPEISVGVITAESRGGAFDLDAVVDALVEDMKERKMGEPALGVKDVDWEGLPAKSIDVGYQGHQFGSFLIIGKDSSLWVVSSWGKGMGGGRQVGKVMDSIRWAESLDASSEEPSEEPEPTSAPEAMGKSAEVPPKPKSEYPFQDVIRNAQGTEIEVRILGRSETEIIFENTEGKSYRYSIDQLSESDQAKFRNLPVTEN